MKKIAVLMSTYNGEKYIKEQIDSILNQEGCEVELIIRDDGSTDKTREIIDKYTHLDNVSILQEKNNLRPAKSFLRLLEVVPKYDYYAFADQDDIWDKDKLISGINCIMYKEKPALYCCNARVVDQDLNSKGYNVYKHEKYVNFESVVINGNFMGCTMVFNNELREKVLMAKKSSYYLMHDYFMSIFCAMIEGEIIYDCTPHMDYRIHNNNSVGISTNLIDKIRKKVKAIFLQKEPRISKQCKSMLEITELGTEKNRAFIRLVSKYNDNFKMKLKLMGNKDVRYEKIFRWMEVNINILKGTL